ncbi:PREDICTED: F-box/FBD/LRR-repeat protein At5g56420-like [Fragaria vesca subsp. vesca]|uniref:F-box/FBD/LRR-repeat protein At5g56420-like n=1 Tax=Fragaria vesca subsp. vesca TaxID=101020 RepID=UPI0002C371C2|nr:PREDICTED: F-box/FBD/LRR-repeat protein At5g56420-like [Fragaria vesca subsp. vesca]
MGSKSRARVEDRISQLPDGVLRHIVTFVPTKCSVRTSVLSTRWKDMWTRVPTLYLNDMEFSSSADFVEFVDRALLVRDSATIQKFHLHFEECPAEYFSRVDGWLQVVVRCNVVELDLSVVSDGEEMLELPNSLLTCKTLEALKLELNYNIKLPTSWRCPKLKFFDVQFTCPDGDSMDFSQFPALEHLGIGGSLGYIGFSFNISVPELKTLRICLGSETITRPCNFLINAPKLQKLDVSEGFLSNYTFKNTKSIIEASIEITTLKDDKSEASADRATKFLAGISGVKCLTLSPFSMACSIPVFDNLSELMLLRDGQWWKILMKFLERSLNLESFVIKHESCQPGHYFPGQKEVFIELPDCRNPDHPDHVEEVLDWTPPESVPKCLLSSLKTISIKGFKGKEFFGFPEEMELIKYLLKNCLLGEYDCLHSWSSLWYTRRILQ